MEEIWKDIIDYENLYKVSNLGFIFEWYEDYLKDSEQ
jgi:hypothetical protein